VSGEVVAANGALADAPGNVNLEPMGKGWFFRVKLSNPSELDGLMDAAKYDAFVKSLA
jgi:glycine cleavage system H protein